MIALSGVWSRFHLAQQRVHLVSVEAATRADRSMAGHRSADVFKPFLERKTVAELREFVVVATLEIKVSYFEIARPGELIAYGRIAKLGRSVGFLEAELRNEDGELLAAATSTAKIIRKNPKD